MAELTQSATAPVSVAILSFDGFNVGLAVNPRLTAGGWTDEFVTFRTDGSIKPLIRQEETEPAVKMKDEASEFAFDNAAIQIGIDSWRNAGYGRWQGAVLNTLNTRLDHYDHPTLQGIVRRSCALLKVEIDASGAQEIATRARGTPRIANNLINFCRDYASEKAQGKITQPVAAAALELLEIDAAGLDLVHAAGPEMKRLYDDLPGSRQGLWRETAAELAAEAAMLVGKGDIVMVKGSNGSKASLVAKALAALGGAA